jgi:outer membrane protein
MKKISLVLLLVLSYSFGFSQVKWDLRKIVDYAMANNISVKQSAVQASISALVFNQSKLSRYPSANFSGNSGFSSGRNQDPTSFSLITQNYVSAGLQLQTSADVFNFFSKRNTIAANEWNFMAAKASVSKVAYDIALSTANAYLQILLAMQQEDITKVQIQQTQFQLTNTRKMVDAGSLPELNATQLEAQLAADSGNYISAKGNVSQATLLLKSLMNIDAAQAFDIETPPVGSIPLETITDLQPEYVYEQALKNQPQQQVNDYNLKAAQKSILAAKAARYPSFSMFGNLSTNYLSFTKRAVYERILNGYQSTGLLADAGGGLFYDVQSPIYTNGNIIGHIRPSAFSTQLNDNFRKAFGLSMNIPIFNGGNAKINYERSKLNFESLQIQKQQDDQKLKQDIYQAYNAAVVALEKFNASKKSVEANEKTYDFAGKRFAIGSLSTFDLITTQNNLLRAKLEYTLNQFDFVFKMKVLEFYKGAGLKL